MSTTTPLTARDIMSTRFLKLNPELDVYDAVDLLLNNRVANAPVVDSAGNLVGFLSEKDCMRCLLDEVYDSNPSIAVEQAMTRDVRVITEETDVLAVADIFLQTPYRRLPVVRGRQLIGLISRRDFISALAKQSRESVKKQHRPTYLYLSSVTDRSVLGVI